MVEIILGFITAWSPYIVGAATAIAAAIKVIKALASKTNEIKKDVLSICKNQSEEIEKIGKNAAAVLSENSELKKKINDMSAALLEQRQLEDQLKSLQEQIVQLTNAVQTQVAESLEKGYEAIELQKKDLIALGVYEYEATKSKN